MSLRTKLFFIFGGLIAALVIGQWWMVRGLTRNILKEVELLAVAVGRDMIAVFESEDAEIRELLKNHGPVKDGNPAGGRKVIRRELRHRAPEAERFEDVVIKEIRSEFEVEKRPADEPVPEDGAVPADGSVVEEKQNTSPVKEREDWSDAELEFHHVELDLDRASNAKYLVVKTLGNSTKIPIPKHRMTDELARLSRFLLLGSVLILLLGLALAAFLAHRVSKPLAALAQAAEAVGDGKFGANVDVSASHREIRKAIDAFNLMSRRLVELDAMERQHRQRQHLSELGEVARGLAHTLRNPLQTLGLSLEQMAGLAKDRDASKALAENASRQIRRIDRWIRTFLALASEGRGEVESLDIGALVRDVVLEALLDNPDKVRVDVAVDDGLPSIRGVAPELRTMVQALVVNAVEASNAGETVNLTVQRDARGGLQLEVLDQGTGIAPAVRERLFTPHVTTKPMGSGMGLFLAHRLATSRYRGELQLLDREPRGTRACLWLPERNVYDEDSHSTG